MSHTWHDLLFLHWPVRAAELRPHVPAPLDLDRFDGQCWVGVVPFRISDIRRRLLPPMPGIRAFAEVNLRTYVRLADRPAVWFLSLDADSPLAVHAARCWYRLPYHHAKVSLEDEGERIRFESVRSDRRAPPAELSLDYAPTGPVSPALPGSLEHWLTERYRLYASGRRGRLLEAEIHHAPWPLQPAAAEIHRNTLAAAIGVDLPGVSPLVHFSRRIEALLWSPTQAFGEAREMTPTGWARDGILTRIGPIPDAANC